MRCVYAILVAICLSSVSQAQYIGRQHHVPNISNRSGGFCSWASGETYGRYMGYHSAIGMRDDRRASGRGGPANGWQVRDEFNRRGIPAVWYSYKQHHIQYPEMVSIVSGYSKSGRRWTHSVILQGRYPNGWTALYDPNHAGRTTWMRTEKFNRVWLGDSTVITRPYGK